jgi:hypothetical protein
MTRNRIDPSSGDARNALAGLSSAQQRVLLQGRCVRRSSTNEFLGLPWYSIAIGPDFAKGERRGHARGVVAVGDIATGIFAFGGWARGVFAFGGFATGLFSFGGLSIGLVAAFGGFALSAVLAIGGAAVGTLAVGGAAAGHYAVGGAPYGTYVIGPRRADPEAVELFADWGFTVPTRSR